VQWNLAQLATAFLSADLCGKEDAQNAVNRYADIVLRLHSDGMARKIGLQAYNEELVTGFQRLMYSAKADFTNAFRALSSVAAEDEFGAVPDCILAALGRPLTAQEAQV
jgi:uncharacterized protein YdiU (UPF0061 family)